jgi:hypothetical protein
MADDNNNNHTLLIVRDLKALDTASHACSW